MKLIIKFIIFIVFIKSSFALPAYENAKEMYDGNDCLTEDSRSIIMEWVIVGDYRIEFFHLPKTEDVGYWKEHCHYQRMQIINLNTEEVVFMKFGRFQPIYKNLTQEKYLFIQNLDSPTSYQFFGWYFDEDGPQEVLNLITRGNYSLTSESSIEVYEIKPHPDGSSYWNCAMSIQPYNIYRYVLSPTGHTKELAKEGPIEDECL